MRQFAAVTLFILSGFVAFAGEIEVVELKSSAIDQTVKVNILLPDGYKQDSQKRFPVVYLLHGYGGDYTEWQRVGVAEEAKGLPVIIVMPEGDKSFYVNQHMTPNRRWEEYITKELVAHVDGAYRTLATREGRAISGLSMGGYGALMLGFRHPELYASAASHSGAVLVPTFEGVAEIAERLRTLFGPEGSPDRQAYDIRELSKNLPKEKRPHLYLDCGSSDFLLDSNRQLVAHLARLGIDYEYREVPGAHNFKYWKSNIRYSLERQLAALAEAQKNPRAEGAGTAAEVVGVWSLAVKFPDQDPRDYELRLREEGGSLKGVLVSPRSGEHPIRSAELKDGTLKVEVERDLQGMMVTLLFEGKPAGGKIAGKFSIKDVPGFEGEWTAERKAQAASP